MIVRVWGTVDSMEVEFTPIPERPGYWEGYCPYKPGMTEVDVKIWAETDKGGRGELECTVQVQFHAHTMAHLILLPYVAHLLDVYQIEVCPERYISHLSGCGKVVE